MINIQEVIKDVPHFDSFCSVGTLDKLVERLRTDSRFEIDIAGRSRNGVPIHHVRFGTGSVKALIVSGAHAMEPIGSITIFSLMSLLHQGNRALLEADVEWHFVPCIDPDGAILNEGWSQKPFTFESYMRNRYVQEMRNQVDASFPITHKRLMWDKPSPEAKILQGILDRVRPDFYFSLHTCWVGGAFYFISRDIGKKYYRELHSLLQQQDFPLQKRPMFREVYPQFAEGVIEMLRVPKWYDYFERTTPSPEKLLSSPGAESWTYLAEIKPDALSFIAEMGHARHPSDESEKETGQNLRQFMLRLVADSQYIATVLLEEWENVKGDVDTASPFYRAIVTDAGAGASFPLDKEKLCEAVFPISWHSARDILFNPQYNRTMTEGDRFNACMVDSGFLLPLYSYQFVRLLKASKETPAVRHAIERLESVFEAALAEVGRHVDFEAFEVFECDTLAKVQLGSGLIALSSLLETQSGMIKQQESKAVDVKKSA